MAYSLHLYDDDESSKRSGEQIDNLTLPKLEYAAVPTTTTLYGLH